MAWSRDERAGLGSWALEEDVAYPTSGVWNLGLGPVMFVCVFVCLFVKTWLLCVLELAL